MLAGAARGKTVSKGGGGPVRLLDVNTSELAGILKPVDMPFHVGSGHGSGWYPGVCE